jgi:hypothetical protein
VKKRVILTLIAVGVAVMYPLVGVGRVKDTAHNLNGRNGIVVPNGEVCRPCHAPHNTNVAAGFLWNHQLSAGNWTLWEGADAASVMSSSSRLCLSCHDGTVAVDNYGGVTNGSIFMDGRDNLGTDLRSSHPIGVEYPTGTRYNQPDATTGQIRDPIETPAGQACVLEEGTVQCASCHYAHGSRMNVSTTTPGGTMFLRVDNTGSKLCMTCHVGPG